MSEDIDVYVVTSVEIDELIESFRRLQSGETLQLFLGSLDSDQPSFAFKLETEEDNEL